MTSSKCHSGLILGLHPANERCRYKVTLSLTGWTQIWNQPCHFYFSTWVRPRRCGYLVTWFCYQLIAKPGNKTATVPWPDPYIEKTQWVTYRSPEEVPLPVGLDELVGLDLFFMQGLSLIQLQLLLKVFQPHQIRAAMAQSPILIHYIDVLPAQLGAWHRLEPKPIHCTTQVANDHQGHTCRPAPQSRHFTAPKIGIILRDNVWSNLCHAIFLQQSLFW